QAEDGIRDRNVTGVQTCALPIFVVKIGFILPTLNSFVVSLSTPTNLNPFTFSLNRSFMSLPILRNIFLHFATSFLLYLFIGVVCCISPLIFSNTTSSFSIKKSYNSSKITELFSIIFFVDLISLSYKCKSPTVKCFIILHSHYEHALFPKYPHKKDIHLIHF